jgi:hypothetical protein
MAILADSLKILVGALTVGLAAALMGPWFDQINTMLGTQFDRVRYPWAYHAARVSVPLIIGLWGLMILFDGIAGFSQ